MDNTAPPAYSPPRRSPTYTAEPGSHETRLAVTSSRRARNPPPSRTFTWRTDTVTLSVLGKEEGVASPIYRRGGVISAEISLNVPPTSVLSVVVQLQGVMNLTVTDAAAISVSVLDRSHTLWKKVDGQQTSQPICPGTLLFEDVLPFTFENGGKTYDLPPTYKIELPGTIHFYADCKYSIVVRTTRSRESLRWRSDIKDNSGIADRLTAEITYRPRARAYAPILSSPFPFSSTIKAAPEEWLEIASQILPYPSQTHVEAIECLLFIPAVRIYALSDNIPVYLQLKARVSSLRAFLHTPPPSASFFRRAKTPPPPPKAPSIRVYLSRQITLNFERGHHFSKSIELGEASLRSIPPDADLAMQADDGFASLDFEGEVRCTADDTVGSFYAGQLLVKDHIVAHIVPPDPVRSPYQEHRNSHPVRLVTEPFMEEPDTEV